MKSNNILFVDFGNVFTKVVAIDVENEELLGAAQSATTLETDLIDGMNDAINELNNKIGKLNYYDIYATSSIDSGLQIAIVGLVPHLSTEAAQKIAQTAGMKVVKTYSYKLSNDDIGELNDLDLDMILVCGGTDGGNKDNILHNAYKLTGVNKDISIIYAGNKNAGHEFKKILDKEFDNIIITENVMPEQKILNVETIINTIIDTYLYRVRKNNIFLKVNREISGLLMPTAYSILNAAQLLAEGIADMDGIGELMVYDCGGSKIDIISIASGGTLSEHIKEVGLPDPYGKISSEEVDLDNGAVNLVDYFGIDKVTNELNTIGCLVEDISKYLNPIEQENCNNETKQVIKNIWDVIYKLHLEKGVREHAGIIEKSDHLLIQKGKDLTQIKYIIGTGGNVINNNHPEKLFEDTHYKITQSHILKPKNPKYIIDKSHILFALGMLSDLEPKKAFKMLKKYLLPSE